MLNSIKRLWLSDGFMKVFKNVSWLFVEKVLRMVVGLFVGVWVTRYLGPQQFGEFAYAQSFVGLFAIVATLGLDGIVVRELVKNKQAKRDVLITSFLLRLLGACILFILLSIAINFTSNDTYTNTLIFIVASAAIFQTFNVIDFYFQSKTLSRYVVFANLITLSVSSVVKVALILNEASLEAFVYVVVFDSFILACGLIYFFYVKILRDIEYAFIHIITRCFYFNIKTAREMLRDSWPLILVGAASAINMRLDQVFLGNMLDKGVVGNYAAAVRIAEVWLILPIIMGSSVYPSLIAVKNASQTLYKNRVLLSIKYMALFTIPVALIVSFLSSDIINALYGDKYMEAGLYLSLYIWTGVPYLIFFITGQVILIENITKIAFYVTLVSVCLNVSLNLLLIPKYGGIGAIIATLITTFISTFASLMLINQKTEIFWKFRSKESPCL